MIEESVTGLADMRLACDPYRVSTPCGFYSCEYTLKNLTRSFGLGPLPKPQPASFVSVHYARNETSVRLSHHSSLSDKEKTSQMRGLFFVAGDGRIELPTTVLETVVIPLN